MPSRAVSASRLNSVPDLWALVAIAIKSALYLGILTAAGTVFAAAVFQIQRYRGLAVTFGVVGLLATILAFMVRGARLTGDAGGMTDPEMLGLLWVTPVGTALLYRLGGLCVLIAGVFMGRLGLWVSVLGGGMAILSFDHVGHISARDTVLLDIVLTLHLLALALWIGILVPLKRLLADRATHGIAADLGHRFGVVAGVAVPVLILAGGYMGYQLAGAVTALPGTGYGRALMLKVALVAVLLALAALNKLRFIPALKAGDPAAAGHLSRSITAEWGVILVLFAVTATLTSTLDLPQ